MQHGVLHAKNVLCSQILKFAITVSEYFTTAPSFVSLHIQVAFRCTLLLFMTRQQIVKLQGRRKVCYKECWQYVCMCKISCVDEKSWA